MSKVQQYVHEFISHDGTPCRAYKRFSYLHGAEVGVADISGGLPQDKAQSLVDAWNRALRRANRGGRYYLDLPDSAALWPDVA